jgi:hypothetical protein
VADLPLVRLQPVEIHPLHPGRIVDRDRDHVLENGAAAHDRQARSRRLRRKVVGLVIPTGYSFNLDGTCLYLATAAVFLAQATNAPLTIEQQMGLLAVLLLASKGRPASPARRSSFWR